MHNRLHKIIIIKNVYSMSTTTFKNFLFIDKLIIHIVGFGQGQVLTGPLILTGPFDRLLKVQLGLTVTYESNSVPTLLSLPHKEDFQLH